MNDQEPDQQQPVAEGQADSPVRRLTSQDLFEDSGELIIEHAGQEYRLRITRQNKLILTK